MSKKNAKVNASRRNFLFGAVRRIKKDDSSGEGPIAASSETISLVRQANDAYQRQEWDEAITLYRQYLKLEKDLDVRMRLGQALYKAGRYNAARLEFRTILAKRPEDLQAILYIGLCFARKGNLQKAADVWRGYFDPMNIPVQRELNVQMGLIEDGMADSPEAVAEAIEALLD